MSQLGRRTNDWGNHSSVREIADLVYERHMEPEDTLEIAAILESMGWTDDRVEKQFGFIDVFQLSSAIWQQRKHIHMSANEYKQPTRIFVRVRQDLLHFLQGTIFALPMAVSIAAMLFLHVSLWSYQYFTVKIATSIAIGTILSFVSVGGFMQGIARQAYYYMLQGYFSMARRITFRFILAGILLSILISIALLLIDQLFPILPMPMIVIAIEYYLSLNAIWLAVTSMYVLRKETIFVLLLSGGIAVVFIGNKFFHINLILLQTFAMLLIFLAGIGLVYHFFRKAEQQKEKGIRVRLPRASILVHTTLPYFLYGTLYFILLFADRTIAWSTHTTFSQYLILFRGEYEVGLDFALLSLIIPTGVAEVIVHRLMLDASNSQKQYLSKQTSQMCQYFVSQYKKSILIILGASIISAALDDMLVMWLFGRSGILLHQSVEWTGTTNYVFIIGLIAYGLLAIGLLNSVVMFSLSRPDFVLSPLLFAIIIDLVTGFLLSRWIGYSNAVIGLLVGVLLFTFMTTRNVLHVLRSLDYHLYLLS